MQLFYHPDISYNTLSAVFAKEESTHIVKVLRKKEGDILCITNGKGVFFEAEIVSVSIKGCSVRIIRKEMKEKPPYYLHMAVAPTKMNDRYEWFLEKAVEIGVDEITPIVCKHSERTSLKTSRLHKIILSAMKQSLRCYLPKLNEVTEISYFFRNELQQQSKCYIAHCHKQERALLSEKLYKDNPQRITILIGPEGDFSHEEINQALQLKYQPVSLGDYRLRTETAAIIACHSVATIHQLANQKINEFKNHC